MFTTAKTPRPFNCCCSCCDSFFAVDLEVGWVEKKGWAVEVVDVGVIFISAVDVVACVVGTIVIVVISVIHFVVAAAGNVV